MANYETPEQGFLLRFCPYLNCRRARLILPKKCRSWNGPGSDAYEKHDEKAMDAIVAVIS